MDSFEENACLCALGHIFGFEPAIALALVRHFGSASEVFRAGSRQTDELLGPFSKYRGQICGQALDNARKELEGLAGRGISYAGYTGEDYPDLLKECADAPTGLYIRGSTPAKELWDSRRCIAIVGTRDISPYGKEWCERLVAALALTKEKPTIVSGLALGTDICAHRAALEHGLPTIAVMATGADRIYPFRNIPVAERMCATPGCALVTDYPPGTPPLALHFLRRNRIIAGLCETLVLTESRAKGGGMNSARLAFSYDRNVHALPGRVDDPRSQGCNILIKSKVAEPLIDIGTFISEHGFNKMSGKKGRARDEAEAPGMLIRRTFGDTCSEQDMKMMELMLGEIRKERGVTIEELGDRTGCGYASASGYAALLEAEGFISSDLLQRCTIKAKNM
ncbi:MAG: DNA-processing protein DprA [Candidatus Cryptobacteroides sp.]